MATPRSNSAPPTSSKSAPATALQLHRVYRPGEIGYLVGGSATIWREKMERGEIPSIEMGRGQRRRHRVATGAAILQYLGLLASHGEALSSIATPPDEQCRAGVELGDRGREKDAAVRPVPPPTRGGAVKRHHGGSH
jgi:hypothetical protein